VEPILVVQAFSWEGQTKQVGIELLGHALMAFENKHGQYGMTDDEQNIAAMNDDELIAAGVYGPRDRGGGTMHVVDEDAKEVDHNAMEVVVEKEEADADADQGDMEVTEDDQE
jgi:hypothetical protein